MRRITYDEISLKFCLQHAENCCEGSDRILAIRLDPKWSIVWRGSQPSSDVGPVFVRAAEAEKTTRARSRKRAP